MKLSKMTGLNLAYFFSNGFWVALRFGIIALFGLLVSIVFTRYTSKEVLGQYQFVISFLGLLAFFSLPGMNLAVLKATSKGNERSIYTALRTTFSYGLLAMPIIIIYGMYRFFWNGEEILGTALIIAGIAFPFFYSPLVWIALYDARLQFRSHAFRTIFTNATTAISLFLGVFFGGNAAVLVSIYLGVNILTNGYFLFEVLRTVKKGSDELDKKYGIAVSLQKCVYNISSNLPPILIAYFFGVHFLAIFYVANALLNFFSGFIGALSNLYMPLLFKYSRIAYRRSIFQNLGIGLVFFLLGMSFLWFFFNFLYGKEYQESLSLAYYFMVLIIVLPLRVFLVNFFTARGKNNLVIKSYIAANILSAGVFYFTHTWETIPSVVLYIYSLHLSLALFLFILFLRWRRTDSHGTVSPIEMKRDTEITLAE